MNENHPIYKAIDAGGGQACDIAGVFRELSNAGFVIVPKEPTDEMVDKGDIWADGPGYAAKVWEAMIDAALTSLSTSEPR